MKGNYAVFLVCGNPPWELTKSVLDRLIKNTSKSIIITRDISENVISYAEKHGIICLTLKEGLISTAKMFNTEPVLLFFNGNLSSKNMLYIARRSGFKIHIIEERSNYENQLRR